MNKCKLKPDSVRVLLFMACKLVVVHIIGFDYKKICIQTIITIIAITVLYISRNAYLANIAICPCPCYVIMNSFMINKLWLPCLIRPGVYMLPQGRTTAVALTSMLAMVTSVMPRWPLRS